MTQVRGIEEKKVWDSRIIDAAGHPLQLWSWGEVKEAHQWKADRVEVVRDGLVIGYAQILLRPLPGPFRALAYIPRGPVVPETANREEVANELAAYVKKVHGAVALTLEPDWEGEMNWSGWHKSSNTILIPRTLILDLHKTEDELLEDATKKTRQYIRKSGKEVSVRQIKRIEEIEQCLDLYEETAYRAGFALHDRQYYRDVFEKMGEYSPVFGSYVDEKLVAFLWLAISGETAFELYGGMNDEGGRLRANYALKWQAIQTMKKWGIHRYDFNGLLNDGVSTFKQGFASHETMLTGTYDKPLSLLYTVWAKGLPVAKSALRRLRRK
jgi:peptidoglycan pentaglycine glycine transferase (the first glycine)